jgi:hypothetical protein
VEKIMIISSDRQVTGWVDDYVPSMDPEYRILEIDKEGVAADLEEVLSELERDLCPRGDAHTPAVDALPC